MPVWLRGLALYKVERGRGQNRPRPAHLSEDIARTVKTHKGVQMEFYRLTKDDPGLPADVKGFLAHGFVLKTVADYGVGPGADVPYDEALEAIGVASRSIAYGAGRPGAT